MKQKMTFNRWLITLMGLVLAADVAIWLDVPVLRQVLGFLCFAIIPGLLIVYAIKLNEIGFLKKFLLSVGLSISFLVFFGLLINFLLPWLVGYAKPLSTPSLVISLSAAIALLCVIAYWRNRNDVPPTFIPWLGQDIKTKSLWLLLFPILFPLLSVIGRHFADTGGNNTILLVMLFLMPLYVILLMWQNKNVPTATYPLALGMISMALLLSYGLISNYLMGGDIYSEYHAFQVVSQNQLWSLAALPTSATASLSISLLPAMLQSVLGINPVYMYKVVFLLLFSLIPVIGYVIYEKYVGHLYGFLASFFFMAQIPFVYLVPVVMRVGLAMLSFSLLFMVLFDDHMVELKKRLLFLLFLFSLVVEYYMIPVILLALMFAVWLAPRIWKGSFDSQTISFIAAVAMPSVLIFFWWGQLTATAFADYVRFTDDVLTNLANLFVTELRSPLIASLFAQSPQWALATQITAIIQRITFVIVGIGVVSTLVRKEPRTKFATYAILMAACLAILVAEIALPWLSYGYGADRLYIQLLIILAPAFIIGCQAIYSIISAVWSRFVRLASSVGRNYRFQFRLNLLTVLIGVILVSQFLSSVRLHEYFLGVHGVVVLDVKRFASYPRYRYDSDVLAARWLAENNKENFPVYMGSILQAGSGEIFEFTEYAVSRKFTVPVYTKEEKPIYGGYIFLVHFNVVNGEVETLIFPGGRPVGKREPLNEYAHLFADRNKIYANGAAEIYR